MKIENVDSEYNADEFEDNLNFNPNYLNISQ